MTRLVECVVNLPPSLGLNLSRLWVASADAEQLKAALGWNAT